MTEILFEKGVKWNKQTNKQIKDIHTTGNITYKYDNLSSPITLLIIKNSNIQQNRPVFGNYYMRLFLILSLVFHTGDNPRSYSSLWAIGSAPWSTIW
jgi:hypothetical protein